MSSVITQLLVPANWESSPGIPLLCFPYAGGSPYLFMDWVARLRPEIRVAGVQLPGKGTRLTESPLRTAEEAVAEVAANFPDLEDRGFALYGHSLGAIFALELARSLCRRGGPRPRHLFVGGAKPPQLGPTRPPLSALPDPEFLEAVQKRYGGIPAKILEQEEILALFLPSLRADFVIYESYICAQQPPLDCPISAFAGESDSLVPASMMQGWGVHTSQAFDLSILPGGHFFLQESRDALIMRIRQRLMAPL